MTITRAVLYSRVSTQTQAQEGVSLDTQLEMARSHCEAKGWHFSGAYTDAGWSGRNDKRPELARLIADAEARAFELVIVYKLDRLGRSARKVYEVLGRLQDAEVSFVSLTQDITNLTSQGKAMTGFYTIVAEMESDMTSERVKAAMRHLVLSGKHFGGRVPLGYDIQEGNYTVNEAEAEIVRDAFDAFLRIRTLRGTCEHLNATGCRTKAGNLFETKCLQIILSNPAYFGQKAWGKNRVIRGRDGKRKRRLDSEEWITCDDAHPAIIERATWDAAQSVLQENKHASPRLVYGRTLSAWSGLIRCAACGDIFNHKNQRAWVCRRHCISGATACENVTHVSDTFLEYRAIPHLFAAIREIHQAGMTAKPKPRARRTDTREKRLAELRARREREKDLFRAGVTQFEEMAANIKRIEGGIAALVGRVEDASAPPQLPDNIEELWRRMSPSQRGEFLRMFVDHCEASAEELIFIMRGDNWPGWPETIAVPRANMRGFKRPR